MFEKLCTWAFWIMGAVAYAAFLILWCYTFTSGIVIHW
jgi:hypothetical protein